MLFPWAPDATTLTQLGNGLTYMIRTYRLKIVVTEIRG
jgi:hypothetical protein